MRAFIEMITGMTIHTIAITDRGPRSPQCKKQFEFLLWRLVITTEMSDSEWIKIMDLVGNCFNYILR